MKVCFLPVVILFASSLALGMNNSDVLRMVRSAAPTSEIIKKINSSEADFRLFSEDVRHLRERYVPDVVIDAMFARNSGEFAQVSVPVQSNSYQPQPRPQNRARREALILNNSTPVRLRLISNVSSASVRVDDRITFEVLEDVLMKNGAGTFLVIKREARALGTITAANPTRIMGHYGTVEVAMDHVELANGDKVAIKGSERADRHVRPGILVFLLAPIGSVVQPMDPVWLTPAGEHPMLKDGLDLTVWTDGVANLDSSEFEQR